MKRRTLILLVSSGLVALLLVVAALRPSVVAVEMERVGRGMEVVVEASGQARVKQRFEVLAPVSGQLQRVEVDPGDRVEAGMVLARIGALPLDTRSQSEAQARFEAARGGVEQARAAWEEARLAREQARRDYERARYLANRGAFSRQELEAARLQARSRAKQSEQARGALERARAELEAARAALDATQSGATGVGGSGAATDEVTVCAPASGEVLTVARESAGPVQAGAQLLSIGDRTQLEVVLDVLTTQATGIDVGEPVQLVQWGGGEPLVGRVARLEPSAFTKVSALGVEEQRVNVIVEPPHGKRWEALSDGYRVEARVVTEQLPDAPTVPSTALFRHGAGWALYAVVDGRARLRKVEVGAISEGKAQLVSGLGSREMVIVFPSDQVGEGTRVEKR